LLQIGSFRPVHAQSAETPYSLTMEVLYRLS
jgi:hypothetical protein